MRTALLIGFLLLFTLSKGQVQDTIHEKSKTISAKDSLKGLATVDTLKAASQQDTVKKETRAERKAREKAEKEREKYYYKNIKKDSARLEIEHLSHVAWRRSLFVPGWGQYTNKGLWWIKVPVIYGGFVTSYLVFDYWQTYYNMFLEELQYRQQYGVGSDTVLGQWDETGLVKQKDYARRNRDLTILATVGWWGLNVVEAYVDSMLKNRWNISSDLSMKVSPSLVPNYAYSSAGGLGMINTRALFAPGVKMTITIK